MLSPAVSFPAYRYKRLREEQWLNGGFQTLGSLPEMPYCLRPRPNPCRLKRLSEMFRIIAELNTYLKSKEILNMKHEVIEKKAARMLDLSVSRVSQLGSR